MGIWHTRQTSSLRGNRFCRRPEWSHCFDLYVFRQPALSWTLLPTMHESRTFFGNPDCVGCRKIAISNNVGGVKGSSSTQRRALGEERPFALVDDFRFPTKGSLAIVAVRTQSDPTISSITTVIMITTSNSPDKGSGMPNHFSGDYCTPWRFPGCPTCEPNFSNCS